MPPAISDGEEGSDIDFDTPAPVTKKSGRDKKRASYKEPEPVVGDEEEDLPVVSDRNGDAVGDEEGDEEDGDEDEEEEDVYVVEKILSHVINESGEPLFEVKWEGYEKKSDRTWEPEANLVDASVALNEYLESIGGRESLFAVKSGVKGKKRGRPSSGTPSATTKRSKKNGDADSDAPLPVRNAPWKPPAGSWEDHIAQLDACEDEDSGKLMVYLTWKNGHKTQHETSVIYQRCPQKMLQFYERHVRIIKREDPDTESVTSEVKMSKLE
ncbi:hypothetical protein B0T16DRAFT_461157 [Cercophora newfieldiana]|uniref:Chromo domain-containing protein n=1 Tax=Cercophora newfieldiana TaxID=92897 RepID=A0AA40CJT9_9PEZI|nr:hypothetical protein B0T16DRAFT_461157 [Cercophora newfieldiana]